jgi:hypothetical protein
MKNPITTIPELQFFIREKLNNAGHHAEDVIDTIPTLLGCAICYGKDLTVKFDEEDKPYGNLIWFTMNETPYCLAYNHKNFKIELRDRSQRGEALKLFDNSTSDDDIKSIFKILSFNVSVVKK